MRNNDRDLLEIYNTEVKYILKHKQKATEKYRQLKKEYNTVKERLVLAEESDDFVEASKYKKVLKRLSSELENVADELVDSNSEYTLDENIKKEIKDQYKRELEAARLEIKMHYGVFQSEMKQAYERFEKILEAERKVVRARSLYHFLENAVLQDDVNKVKIDYFNGFNWDLDKYEDHNLSCMPNTTINSLKNDFENKLMAKKLKIHRKYYKK